MKGAKEHWEKIYGTKTPKQVSWTQDVPKMSLMFISQAHLPKSAHIIDVGGGDSNFVDHLLSLGYENISILDISEEALNRAKERLGTSADKVNWIVSDVTEFHPSETYDFWHDRAAFHFLTTEEQVSKYLEITRSAVKPAGLVTIGTFSKTGPTKCSGLEIAQYDEETLTAELDLGFEKLKCVNETHTTPFNTSQDFLFCSFKRTAA